MTDVVLTPATFEVAFADEDILGVSGFQQGKVTFQVRRQQRIFKTHGEYGTTKEKAARRDLGNGAIIMERKFRVQLGIFGDIVVGRSVETVALGRTLIIVVRREVELIGRSREGARVAGGIDHNTACAGIKPEQPCRRRGARAAASKCSASSIGTE